MLGYKVAVMGATGLVGRMFLTILEERNFPIKELKLLATKRSVGKKLEFQGEKISVEVTKPESFHGCDLAFFSAGSAASKEMAINAVASDCLVIDNSSAWRMAPHVPLVVPEVNPEAINTHQGIIANPNCSTIQLVVALNPIKTQLGLTRVIASTYQAVSGTGWKAIEELKNQSVHILNREEIKSQVYPYQIAFNLLPQVDIFCDGYSREEMKIINETKKIMSDPTLKIAATTVRVPVFSGHSESIYIETEKNAEVNDIKKILEKAPGITVYDDVDKLEYPMPILIEESDQVWIGRIRPDMDEVGAFHLWVVANNLRKGAATNAVQIGEELIRRGLL